MLEAKAPPRMRFCAVPRTAWSMNGRKWQVAGSQEFEVGLMHEGRGLKRLSRLLLGQPGRGQFTQLVVDQRQKLRGRGRIAGFDLA